MIFTLIFGSLIDKGLDTFTTIVIGFSFLAASKVNMYFSQDLGLLIFGIFVHGIGWAAALIGGLVDMIRTIQESGSSSMVASQLASCLYIGAAASGNGLGTLIGGFAYDQVGFQAEI